MRKIAPKQRHIARIQIPTKSKQERVPGQRPDKQAHRQGARKRNPRLREMEEHSADQADAAGETDARHGSDQAILPARGGNEEGGIQQSAERENAHRKRNNFAEIEKRVKASGVERWLRKRTLR